MRTLRVAAAEPCPLRDPGEGTGEDMWISLSDESRSGPALWRLLKRPIFEEWVKKKKAQADCKREKEWRPYICTMKLAGDYLFAILVGRNKIKALCCHLSCPITLV